MSPELEAFLAAEDLDELLDARGKLDQRSEDDDAVVRQVCDRWENTQAVSNLLFHPLLIPADIRWNCIVRGLDAHDTPYLKLAAVVGLQAVTDLSERERTAITECLFELIRHHNDAIGQRATVTIAGFISDNEFAQVVRLLDHPDDTVVKNLTSWLIEKSESHSLEQFEQRLRDVAPNTDSSSALEMFREHKAKIDAGEFSWLGPLFSYIPNLKDIQG